MGNPNPTRISAPMWRLWEEFQKFEPQVKLGGIYADKAGYHNRRSALPQSDYSVEDVAADRQGPSDKASAWDLTLPESKMKLYTKRLVDACKRRDPRLFKNGQPIIREIIGTLDGKTVYCYVLVGGKPLGVGADSGPDPGRDKSHLWHIHISLIRKYINDWDAIAGILAILKGESPSTGKVEEEMNLSDKIKGTDSTSRTVEDVLADLANLRNYLVTPTTKTGQKVTPSAGSPLALIARIPELEKKLDQVIATPPGSVVISDEQLERVLRKVIGSVDAENFRS